MASEKENSGSGSSDHRRSTKPIMEKRRRARINASLAELKSLLLEVMRREGSRHSKMEKADILEMTVRHLRQVQKQHFAAAVANDPSILNKYMTGFNECAAEVSRYLNTIDGVDPDVRARLLNHLANCVQGVSETSPSSMSPTAHAHTPSATVAHVRPIQAQIPVSSAGGSPPHVTIAPKPAVVPEINNNSISCVSNVQMSIPTSQPQQQQQVSFLGGVPVLPGKTPSGELAFVIPSNVLSNGQLPSYVIPVYAGSVTSSGTTHVKPASVAPPTATVVPCKQENVIQAPKEAKNDKSTQSKPHSELPNVQPEQNLEEPHAAEDDRDVWRPW